MARPRWQGDEAEARRVDRQDAETMRALGYSEADILAETRRREQSRFDEFNARQILTAAVAEPFDEILAAFVPPLPRGHRVDPNTEQKEILLPCPDCERPIEHDDSDHAEGCRYFEPVVGDWRL